GKSEPMKTTAATAPPASSATTIAMIKIMEDLPPGAGVASTGDTATPVSATVGAGAGFTASGALMPVSTTVRGAGRDVVCWAGSAVGCGSTAATPPACCCQACCISRTFWKRSPGAFCSARMSSGTAHSGTPG
ncbi:MAG: hypothetical protein CMJ84_02645, partial [Planctomycetes bacterium]|nr:hypothetical protein [Planctomycetota bacterium]